MTTVNKTLQRDWIHALESGKYKQGQNCLRDQNNKFCCLGVLCDIVAPERWSMSKIYKDYIHDAGGFGPSAEIRKLAGLIENNVDCALVSPLMEMNDEHKDSFEDIALTLRLLFDIWD